MALAKWTLRSALAAVVLAGTGCGRLLDYQPPRGFAEAESDWRSRHYKGSDNVGLKIVALDNVDGGTLDYWGADLVEKLQRRGYTLEKTTPVVSANKVPGRRYDFRVSGDDGQPMFLLVGLFVTDDYRYVAQLAGRADALAAQQASLPRLFADFRAGGCRGRNSICKPARKQT